MSAHPKPSHPARKTEPHKKDGPHKKDDGAKEKPEKAPEKPEGGGGEKPEGGGGEKPEGGGEKPAGKSLPNADRLDHHRDKTVAVDAPGKQKSAVFKVGVLSWTEPVHKAVNGFTHAGPAVLTTLTDLERRYGTRWYALRRALVDQQKEIRDCTNRLANMEFGDWLANGWYKAVVVTTEAAGAFNAGSELVEDLKGFHEHYKPFVSSLKTLATDAKVFFSTNGFKQAKAAKTKKDFEDGFNRFKNLFDTSKELGDHLAKIHTALTVDEPPKELAEADAEYQKELRGFPGEIHKDMVKAFDDKFEEVKKQAADAAIGDPYAKNELSEDKEKIRNAYKALHKTTRYLHAAKSVKDLTRIATKMGLKFNPAKLTATVVGNEHVAKLAVSGAEVLKAWAREANHVAEEDLSQAFAFLLVLNQQYVRANHAYWSVKTYRAQIAAKLGVFLEPVKIDFPEAHAKKVDLDQLVDQAVQKGGPRAAMMF